MKRTLDELCPRPAVRMTLGRLLAMAASLRGPSVHRQRKPRYVREAETTPVVHQPSVRFDGVIESPVPRGVARSLRSRG
jgi:hypothetical protein